MPRTYKPTGRPRGRPKGSPNKPKTVEALIAKMIRDPVVVPKPEPRPKGPLPPNIANLTPEERSARARKAAAASIGKSGRKKGVPFHTSKARHDAAKAVLAPEIKRIIRIMKKQGVIEKDAGTIQAVAALLEIIGGDEKASDRIAAARTYLDFHKTKPVAKQEVTVKTPADFLRELAEEDDAEQAE